MKKTHNKVENSKKMEQTEQTMHAGKTYKQKEQILRVLTAAKLSETKWMTTREIVNVANMLGVTEPMDDATRLAHSHPYSKILSLMQDPTQSYFEAALMSRERESEHKTEFRLSY